MAGGDGVSERVALVNEQIRRFWAQHAPGRHAPTVEELWLEQERVAEKDLKDGPTFEEVLEHFEWFFRVQE